MENKCCEKCRIYNFETNTKGADCSLPGCECHTSPKEECNDKDDMFARTNEGDGYMQCQIHLRNSIKCDRLHKHLVSSPKEETYCRYGAKNCFDHPPKEEDKIDEHIKSVENLLQRGDRVIKRLKEIEDSPKEEIVNDWESELSEIIFQIQRCPKQYRTCFNCKETLESHISSLLSSTEKRVANEIIGEIKRYSYETKIDGRFMKLTEIINLIKPKYE